MPWNAKGRRHGTATDPHKQAWLNHGFTLIELLVVIAIIALLVAILMPSLTKARELAKMTACKVNLRSCGTALHLYASDHGDYPLEGQPGLGDWHIERMIESQYVTRDLWRCMGTPGEYGFHGSPWSPVPTTYKNWNDYSVFLYRGPWAPEKKDGDGKVINSGGFPDDAVPGNTATVFMFFSSVPMVNSFLAGYPGYRYQKETCPSLRYPHKRMTQMACPSGKYIGQSIFRVSRMAAIKNEWPFDAAFPGNGTSTAAVHMSQTAENFYWSDGAVQTAQYAPGLYIGRGSDKTVYAWAGLR